MTSQTKFRDLLRNRLRDKRRPKEAQVEVEETHLMGKVDKAVKKPAKKAKK